MKTAYLSTIPKIEAVQLDYMTPDCPKGREWERLVASSTTTGFRQSLRWAHLQAQLGFRVIHMGLMERGNLVGGAVGYLSAKTTRSDIPCLVVPEGPVLDWLDEARSAKSLDILNAFWQDKATKFGAAGVCIEPRVTPYMMPLLQAFKPVTSNTLPRQAMCLDLRSSGQQLFASMNGEAKYNVQLARNSHLILTEYESSEALQWFYGLLQNVDAKERIQFPSLSQLTALCDTLCPSGTAKIYVARHKGVVLAAAIMIKFGPRATLLHAVVREHECRMMAGYGMLWHMIERSRQMGCNSFDLNCFGEPAQASNMANLTRQCNGNVMRFVGAWQFQFSQFARLTYTA